MFLLLLMGLGAASVKAQVRIGGNTPPSATAVLDLNAGNDNVANTATGGLVLPRVDLTSSTKQLTPGVANQTGTMVYNVTTTLGRIGVYYWNGNSWVLASLPSTSAGDSGLILISNGSTFQLSSGVLSNVYTYDTVKSRALGDVTWTKVLDTTIALPAFARKVVQYLHVGLSGSDLCYIAGNQDFVAFPWTTGKLGIMLRTGATSNGGSLHLKCLRPSI